MFVNGRELCHHEGGYEACSSFFMPTLEEEIVAAAKEMLENLK